MKNQLKTIFLIISVLLLFISLVACGNTNEPTQCTYTFFDEDGITVLKTSTVDYGSPIIEPVNPTKIKTDEFTYTFKAWNKEIPDSITEDIEFIAVYTAVKNQYTYTFYDDDGITILKREKVDYGSPIIEPVNPTKIKTDEFTYNFKAWNKEIPDSITEDIEFIAVYTTVKNQYTYTFYEEDGITVLKTVTVDYGSQIIEPFPPIKAESKKFYYMFDRWDKNIPDMLTADINFTPIFYETLREYTYIFYDEDGIETLKSTTVDYGSQIIPPENPKKAETERSSYSFSGWDKEIPISIEENITFIAIYSETVKQYTYTFFDDDGTTVLKAATVDYGSQIVPPLPTKSSTAQYTYIFSGWDKPISETITQDITFIASYSQMVNKYTYTFYHEEQILKTVEVDYGSEIIPPDNPTKESNQVYVFIFDGWDKEIPDVIIEDITFRSQFSYKYQQYTYIFYDEDGKTVLAKQTADFNSPIIEPTIIPTKQPSESQVFTFNGWEPGLPPTLQKDEIFIAQFSALTRSYTVMFETNGGTVIQAIPVDYNSTFWEPLAPLKTGFELDGWYKESDYQNLWDFDTDKIVGETKLYAKWYQAGLVFNSINNGIEYELQQVSPEIAGDIIVPDYYRSKPITAIAEKAFLYCSLVTSVTIPQSVKSIGSEAFKDCTRLQFLNLPSNLIVISSGLFFGCSSLNNVTIPEKVISIGHYAFKGCSSLTVLLIPDSVISIGNSAFDSCISLENITIGNNINIMGEGVFSNCSGLKTVLLGSGLNRISENTFSGCSQLQNIIIPTNITIIGEYAFSECTSLMQIVIHENMTEIEGYAFSGCTLLLNITINVDTPPLYHINAFTGTPYNTKIYVPAASVETYKKSNRWSSYASQIEGIA